MWEFTYAAAWIWMLMEEWRKFDERQMMIADDDGMANALNS